MLISTLNSKMKNYPKETAESRLFDTIFGGIARLFRRRREPQQLVKGSIDKAYVRAEWTKVQNLMVMGGESRYQQAIVSADKLLDYVLKAHVPGETMGDRLKNANNIFSNRDTYQAAWRGHKLRNRLVHETNYQALSWEAQRAIKDFEKVLRDLKVL